MAANASCRTSPLLFGSVLDRIVIAKRNYSEDVVDDDSKNSLCQPQSEDTWNINLPAEHLWTDDNSERENIRVQHVVPHGSVGTFTTNRKILNRRVINQSNNCGVKCKVRHCTEIFGSCHALAYHLINYHANGVKKMFKCHLCKKTLASKTIVQRHVGSVHAGLKPFKCTFPTCLKTFTEKGNLKQHVNGIHTTKDAFKCLKCSRKFNYKSNMTKHLAYTHGVRIIYSCYSCKISLSNRSKLQQHMNVMHTGLNLSKCPVCSKGFATKNYLQKYMNGTCGQVKV